MKKDKPLTLAEAKRRCVPGVGLTLVWHAHAAMWGAVTNKPEMVAERAALVAGEGVPGAVKHRWANAILIERGGRESMLQWPKASDFRVDGPNAFTILEDGKPCMSYRIEPTT
jgi:hypothetical protein